MISLVTAAQAEMESMVDRFVKQATNSRRQQLAKVDQFLKDRAAQFSDSGYGGDRYRYFRAWAFICIDARASGVSRLPWRMAEITHADPNRDRRHSPWREKIPQHVRNKAHLTQELEPIMSHDALDLLDHPNPYQNSSQFLYFSVANLDITGECYWIVGLDEDNHEAVYSVPSSWMRWDRRGNIYKLRVGGGAEEHSIPSEFVARTYYPDPSDPTSCYSPLAACLAAIRTDDYIQQSQQIGFQRGIHPNLIVSIAKDPETNRRHELSGWQRRQIMRSITELWSETVNRGLPAVVDGLIDSVHKLQATPQEMDWPASGEIVKKRIMQTFRVNPYIVGEVTGVNRAQAAVALATFNQFVINPIAASLSETMTDLLGSRYDDAKRILFYLEEATAIDREQRLKEWSTLRRTDDVTRDEYREAILDRPPLEDRDDPTEVLSLVGGWSGILQALQMVGQGLITREQLINALVVVTRMSEDDAISIVGRTPPPAPSLPPPPVLPPVIDKVEGAEEEEMAEKSGKSTDRLSLRKAREKEHIQRYQVAEGELGQALAKFFRRNREGVVDSP